jgi:aryl-alcohol dehydrogenase-like predicted oxidoreductase
VVAGTGDADISNARRAGYRFVPYCPTARSFLAGAVNPSQRFDSTDRRHNLPRFQPDALAKNMVLLEFAQSWARRKNTTPVQFALAWVMAQRPWIVPIPVRRNIRT